MITRSIGFVTLFLIFGGCTPLHQGDSRKITAWGVYAVTGVGVIGIGYIHTERGPGENILSEESAKPFLPRLAAPIMK
jgi:hypothetical protein